MASRAVFGVLLLIYLEIRIAQAGNQYCYPRGSVNEFQLGWSHQFIEDKIIPTTDGDPVPKEGINCQWRIPADHLDDPIVVLSDFDWFKHVSRRRQIRSADSEARTPLMRYELHLQTSNSSCSSASSKEPKPVELGMLRVLQLPRRSYLTVSFRLTQDSGSRSTPGLWIRLMEPGFCGREMTNFDSSCFTISTTRRSLSAELSAINEDSKLMRLASFNSSRALRNFVRESERTLVGTGLSTSRKVPLNLTQSLRIGLFFEHRTKSIFYLSGAEDKCELSRFEDSNMLYFTVQSTNSPVSCGSLRAAHLPGGDAVVDFTECSEPLPALISFSDAARSRCGNCSHTVLTWLRAAAQEPREPRDEKPGSNDSQKIDLLPVTAALATLLVVVLGVLAVFIRLSLRTRRRNSVNKIDCQEKNASKKFHTNANWNSSKLLDSNFNCTRDRMYKYDMPGPSRAVTEITIPEDVDEEAYKVQLN